MLPSTMFCFVSAMVSLEEADEKTAAYLFITPLRITGYLCARFGIPAVTAFFVTAVLLPVFKLTAFWMGKAACENSLFYMFPAFGLSAVWIVVLLKRYLRKI